MAVKRFEETRADGTNSPQLLHCYQQSANWCLWQTGKKNCYGKEKVDRPMKGSRTRDKWLVSQTVGIFIQRELSSSSGWKHFLFQYRDFQEWPCRYRYFKKVPMYRKSIFLSIYRTALRGSEKGWTGYCSTGGPIHTLIHSFLFVAMFLKPKTLH